MTTDRGRLGALRTLVERRDAGGYSLPEPILDAYRLTRRVAAVTVEPPVPFLHADAAAELLETVARSEPVDLHAVGVQVRRAVEAGQDVEHANRVASAAVEQAQARALAVVERHADIIIVEHLRPAYDETLEQAGRAAAVLAGHPLDHGALITAPAKVRAAWQTLRDAGQRYRLLREARAQANTAGERHPQHDTAGEFATLVAPVELFPNHPPTAPLPQLPFPTDPVELVLWLIGPAAAAKPWLPTSAEQDAAWLAAHGEDAEWRRAGHGHALAVAGR